ncbi:unnamed protein product [Calypogeia fissa]
MTILMLMVIILSIITSVVNMRTTKVVAQYGPSQWVQVDPTYFRYNEFIKDNRSTTLTLLYSATIDNDPQAFKLTSPGFTSGKTCICQGLLIHSKGIPFQGINPNTNIFSTTAFNSFISLSVSSSVIHHSKAPIVFFLMAIPVDSSAKGAALNLTSLSLSNMKPPINVIAIEYEKCMSKVFNDFNTSCVGTDIANVPSLARINPYILDLSPNDGSLRYSWVDYNDFSKELEVRISNGSNRPHQPIIKISISPTPPYTNLMYVGFSSRMHLNHVHKVLIHSWSFETHTNMASLMNPNNSLSPAPSIAPSPTPNNGSIAPVPIGPIPYEGSPNNTLAGRSAYFGKVLGTTLAVLFLIMLLLGILIDFSQFGFACIANPDDLIEMEFSTLGEFSSSGDQGKETVQEDVEGIYDSSSKEKESTKSDTMETKLAQAKKQPRRNFSELLSGEEYHFGQGSLWGDELNYHGSLEDEAPRLDSKTQTTIEGRRKSFRSSVTTVILGLRRPSRLVEEPGEELLDPPNNLGKRNEKEQIATLLKEAAHIEEEVEATRYQYKELSEATNGFASSNKLGGTLLESYATYRGFLQESSTDIAVKVMNIELLKTKSKEVRAEMSILSRLQHPSLVKFLGWCKQRGQFYIVYELSNGQSLDKILFQNDGYVATYPWKNRFETIKAIANALHYLHEGWKSPIIHRNVKSSSVIIGSDQTTSRLGDYGLSCLIDLELLETSSPYFQDPTFGGLAPEFVESKTGTQYTDVYSFGILCLEICCRRRFEDHKQPLEERILVDWVSYLRDEDKLTDAIEDDIMTENEIQQFMLVLRLGLMCVDLLPQGRPTMKQVVQCLSGQIPFPLLPISEATDIGEETILNPDDSIASQEDPISFKNMLFEKKNEWSDISFSVGDTAPSFAQSTPKNSSWVDIHDNILFIGNDTKPPLSSSQGNVTWVEIHDVDILVGNDTSSDKPSNLANCSWVDDIDISLDDIINPISSQEEQERVDTRNQSFDLRFQQIHNNSLWTEIPTLNFKVDLDSQSSQVDQPISLEWTDFSEVFSSLPANMNAIPFKSQEGKQPQSVHSSLTTVRPLPSSPTVEKIQLLPIAENLPPPKWPLLIPKLKPISKPKMQIQPLDVSHALSLPSLQAKGIHIHLNNASTPSNISTLYKAHRSQGPDSTLPSSVTSSTLGSPLLPSSSPLSPSTYGKKTIPTSSQHWEDDLNQGSSSSLSSRTPPTMELIDLKAHSNIVRHPKKSLGKNPDKPHQDSSSKSKLSPTSQLLLFPPKWPIPLPKSKSMKKKSDIVGSQQVRSLVKNKKA